MNVLIVDDDYHARKLLAHYVEKIPFLNLKGSCSDVFEAMALMKNQNIDLLILDIHMPNMTGIEFSRSLKNGPIIIFSTAFSEYALEGFELEAVDYLMKPVEFPRFLTACYKARDRYEYKNHLHKKDDTENKVQNVDVTGFFTVKDGVKLHKINYSDLLFIEGQREYVTFHSSKGRITALFTLKNLEETLPADLFVRVHKSYIVSINNIELVEGNLLKITVHKIPIGSSYKADLLKLLIKK